MKPSIGKLPLTKALLFENSGRFELNTVLGTAETILSSRAKKSGQGKQALGVAVPPFIMHFYAIVFILEP